VTVILQGLPRPQCECVDCRPAGIEGNRVGARAVDYGIVENSAAVIRHDWIGAPICRVAPVSAAINPSGNRLSMCAGTSQTEEE
jgi:hypothetical protein